METHELCRSSRPLYEALLSLERQGAVVVERPLSLVDLVLSPSAGLVVCDNSAAKLVGRAGGRGCFARMDAFGPGTRLNEAVIRP